MGEWEVRCPVARLVAPRVEPFRNSCAVRAEAPSNHRRDVLQQPEPVSAPQKQVCETGTETDTQKDTGTGKDAQVEAETVTQTETERGSAAGRREGICMGGVGTRSRQ